MTLADGKVMTGQIVDREARAGKRNEHRNQVKGLRSRDYGAV